VRPSRLEAYGRKSGTPTEPWALILTSANKDRSDADCLPLSTLAIGQIPGMFWHASSCLRTVKKYYSNIGVMMIFYWLS